MTPTHSVSRNRYIRPVRVAVSLYVLAELAIFVVFGLILYPEGSWFGKFLWTVVFCGFGMGASVGAYIDWLIIDRFDGLGAMTATVIVSMAFIVGCDFLCLTMDEHLGYFGGSENPGLFIGAGVITGLLGSVSAAWLLFTPSGLNILTRLGW